MLAFYYRLLLKVFTTYLLVSCISSATADAPESKEIVVNLFSGNQDIDNYLYTEPADAYQQIINVSQDTSNMTESNQIWWLLRKAQVENVLYLYEKFNHTVAQATQLTSKVSDPKALAQLSFYQGIAAERAGNYTQAKSYIEKAIVISKSMKSNRIFVLAKREMAYLQTLSEVIEGSLIGLHEAYVEAFALNDVYLIAAINETYGVIYDHLGEYEKSVEYYEKALDSYLLLGYKGHFAEAIYGLASTYRAWKKYDKAIETFNWYQAKINYSNSPHLQFFAWYGLGMTLAEKGDCEGALIVIDKALTSVGLADFKAELYKKQAGCYIQLNQLKSAEQALETAKRIFADFPELLDSRWQLELIKIKSSLKYAQGYYKESVDLLNRYYDQYLELIIINNSERMINVRTKLESERKTMENVLIKQRNKVNKLQEDKIKQQIIQQWYLLIFIVSVVLVMVILFLIHYKNHQKVLALSNIDALSNLYNRRYIFDYLDKLFQAYMPAKTELCILLMDIDDFKQINDIYGHPFGDEVIRKIAQIGKDTLRTEDVMGRIGGEEFLCVLPRIDQKQCVTIAQRLLNNINQHQFCTPDGELFTTSVSIGIARLNDKTIDSDMLYVQADQALYQSKRSGKNCVMTYKLRASDEVA